MFDCDQPFADQLIENRRRIGSVDLYIGDDVGRRFLRKRPNENRKTFQRQTLQRRQQVVAPIEHRAQGLMPWQGRPAPRPAEGKTLAQQGVRGFQAMAGNAHCRQFDRQCHAFQTLAHVGYQLRIVVVQHQRCVTR
ncbi:hypothetical protein D3C85_1413460 [compost metagenome]